MGVCRGEEYPQESSPWDPVALWVFIPPAFSQALNIYNSI